MPFFFFKQKTAYELRISDWSSDVCSSDLGLTYLPPGQSKPILQNVSFAVEPGMALGIIGPSGAGKSTLCGLMLGALRPSDGHVRLDHEIGRASCRARVCQYG